MNTFKLVMYMTYILNSSPLTESLLVEGLPTPKMCYLMGKLREDETRQLMVKAKVPIKQIKWDCYPTSDEQSGDQPKYRY